MTNTISPSIIHQAYTGKKFIKKQNLLVNSVEISDIAHTASRKCADSTVPHDRQTVKFPILLLTWLPALTDVPLLWLAAYIKRVPHLSLPRSSPLHKPSIRQQSDCQLEMRAANFERDRCCWITSRRTGHFRTALAEASDRENSLRRGNYITMQGSLANSLFWITSAMLGLNTSPLSSSLCSRHPPATPPPPPLPLIPCLCCRYNFNPGSSLPLPKSDYESQLNLFHNLRHGFRVIRVSP